MSCGSLGVYREEAVNPRERGAVKAVAGCYTPSWTHRYQWSGPALYGLCACTHMGDLTRPLVHVGHRFRWESTGFEKTARRMMSSRSLSRTF